jgi:hypothetical protein
MAAQGAFTRSAASDQVSDIAAAAGSVLFSQTELSPYGAGPAAGEPLAERLDLMGREELILPPAVGGTPAHCAPRPAEPADEIGPSAVTMPVVILSRG